MADNTNGKGITNKVTRLVSSMKSYFLYIHSNTDLEKIRKTVVDDQRQVSSQ